MKAVPWWITVISGSMLVKRSSGFLKSGRSTKISLPSGRWRRTCWARSFRTALCRHVYRPCWAEVGQLFRMWFSVSGPAQLGHESDGSLPHLWRLELVGRTLIKALLAKFAMLEFMRARWCDQFVASEPVKAALRHLNKLDWTVSPSSFSRFVASWRALALAAASFLSTSATRSLNGTLSARSSWRTLILGSWECCSARAVPRRDT